MFKPFPHLKRFYIYYLLILFLIYPSFPVFLNIFLTLKEPIFLSPINVTAEGKIPIRSDLYGAGDYGARRSGGKRHHNGLDIKAKAGDAVFASKSGFAKTGQVTNGMGKFVRIDHRGGYSTVYGHLSKITIKNNQWVWQGTKIGEVGKTGNANYRGIQSHLHFEIRHKNQYLDPSEYLWPRSQ